MVTHDLQRARTSEYGVIGKHTVSRSPTQVKVGLADLNLGLN